VPERALPLATPRRPEGRSSRWSTLRSRHCESSSARCPSESRRLTTSPDWRPGCQGLPKRVSELHHQMDRPKSHGAGLRTGAPTLSAPNPVVAYAPRGQLRAVRAGGRPTRRSPATPIGRSLVAQVGMPAPVTSGSVPITRQVARSESSTKPSQSDTRSPRSLARRLAGGLVNELRGSACAPARSPTGIGRDRTLQPFCTRGRALWPLSRSDPCRHH
jgi:hypothetical protein